MILKGHQYERLRLFDHRCSYIQLLSFMKYSLFVYLLVPTIVLLFQLSPAVAEQEGVKNSKQFSQDNVNVKIHILSPSTVRGVAGQFVKLEGTITKLHDSSAKIKNNGSGVAYISIVDVTDKAPVDLEDWSAEKGLYIPFLDNGQSLPLEWNVRLVKAGSYTITILFNSIDDNSSPPVVSDRINMEVSPKHNLNPGNVLPIAFGVPAALIGFFGILNYYRGKKTGIYS